MRRNSNGVTDDMSLYNSIDFPNRSEASAGSDFDSILRSQQNQISCLQTNITPIHPIPLHMYVVSSKILLIVKDSTSRNHILLMNVHLDEKHAKCHYMPLWDCKGQ